MPGPKPPPVPTPAQCSSSPSPVQNVTKSPASSQVSLQQPSTKKGPSKSTKLLQRFRSAFKSFPIISPAGCKIPVGQRLLVDSHVNGGTRMTGTLFGYRKSRVNLVLQENPRSLPMLVLELSIQTGKLLQDMGLGPVRIALEAEKHPGEKIKIKDEPIWTMYCNGRKAGYAVKREATQNDLNVMQMLHAMSMGAGVLPGEIIDSAEGDLTYMRAWFERVIGSNDHETYHMMNPDGNVGPELSIFFVRI